MKNQIIKGAVIAAIASASFQATAEEASWNISGWINEGMTYWDDGVGSDVTQMSDNGTTLGSRITLSGNTPLANTGLSAGFEVIMEILTTETPLISADQAGVDSVFGTDIGVLGSSINVSGAFGKVTLGTQSMPTDNIAVLADPSLTLWSGISPVFRGNGFAIQGIGASGVVWGDFLGCLGESALQRAGGIGIDCNGIYRNGIRYDLPAFGPVSIAVGYANDDVYDVAVKYSGTIGRLTANVHGGYSYNANGGIAGAAANELGSDTFQIQAGLMDSVTGLFGSIAYQTEEADDAAANTGNDTDAWWFKGGIKRQWIPAGDTAISFDFGQYNDQFAGLNSILGLTGTDVITGSEVQRWGIAVDQYFGSNLIIYGKYENLSLDVDGGTSGGASLFSGSEDLDTFTIGLTYFF